jgi:ATP-dependent DNA ligase
VRFYSRNAFDWTTRLSAIAAAAELIKANSFTIDGGPTLRKLAKPRAPVWWDQG